MSAIEEEEENKDLRRSRSVEDLSFDVLDLAPYINHSAISVPQTFGGRRMFSMFKSLGLRHLPVVDEHSRVVGIVTRKELLDESISEKLTAMGFHFGGH